MEGSLLALAKSIYYLSTAQFNDTAFQTRNIKRETPVDVVILFLFP